MICAWTETSSAETGSSSTISLRLERQRARDADALALAAGELVREAVDVLGVQPDAVEQLAHAAPRSWPRGRPVQLQRRADDLADALARVQRRVRVLEDHLHLAPQRLHRSRGRPCVMSSPRKRIVPVGRRRQPHDRARQRGLAAARLADEPERLALVEREATRRRPRARAPTSRSTSTPCLIGKWTFEVLDLEQRRVASQARASRLAHGAPASARRARSRPAAPRAARASPRRSASSGRGARAHRPGAPRAAGPRVHLPNACGQRGRKWQPSGGRRSDGGSPAIAGSRSGRGRSTRAIEPSSPHVYGCCGS